MVHPAVASATESAAAFLVYLAAHPTTQSSLPDDVGFWPGPPRFQPAKSTRDSPPQGDVASSRPSSRRKARERRGPLHPGSVLVCLHQTLHVDLARAGGHAPGLHHPVGLGIGSLHSRVAGDAFSRKNRKRYQRRVVGQFKLTHYAAVVRRHHEKSLIRLLLAGSLGCSSRTPALCRSPTWPCRETGAVAPGLRVVYRPKLRSSSRSSAISLRSAATDFSPASSALSFSASRPMKNVASVAVT